MLAMSLSTEGDFGRDTLQYDRTGKLVARLPDMRTMNQFPEMLAQAGLQ